MHNMSCGFASRIAIVFIMWHQGSKYSSAHG